MVILFRQPALAGDKHGFGKICRQLTPEQRSVTRAGCKLRRHFFVSAYQFKRNRLTAQGQINKKLLECFLGNIQLVRQRCLKFN